ncbi:MAG: dethiobiotin synthase [Polynucleobacter sp.]|nr:dethiobiotin synthase [Polynucleobacter sp.]MDZ4055895.1 dethiobiotin synthase [Polynucleobacter sp.]
MNANHNNGFSGFFVTGTDTEIGKTLIASALILKIKALCPEKTVFGFKPVVAGTYRSGNNATANEDLESLKLASGYSGNASDLCPYVLPTPAAPHLVAQSLGITLELDTMLSAFHALHQNADCMVVEGAGGFLVPMNDQLDLSDFARALNLPVILVVGMRLGCINHALLTAEAIAQRGLTIAGWVANTLDPAMPFLNENVQTLSNRIPAPLLGTVGRLPLPQQHTSNAPYSLEAMQFAAEALDLSRITRLIT